MKISGTGLASASSVRSSSACYSPSALPYRSSRLGWVLPLVFLMGCANALGLCTEPKLRNEVVSAGGSGGGGGGSAYADVVLADHPVAYFRFEDASSPLVNAIDSTLPATPDGGVTLGVPGAVGHGIAFDGQAGSAVIGDDFDFTGDVAMSIEVWAECDDPLRFQHMIQKRTAVEPFDGYSLTIDGQGLINFTRIENGDFRHVKFAMPTGFVHIVGTFDGAVSRLFVNGEQVDVNDMAGAATLGDTLVPLRIGGNATGSTFSGTLDELAIYASALTPDRIKAHFQAASP